MGKHYGKRPGGGEGGPKKKAKFLPSKGNNQAIPHGSRGILVTCFNGWEDRTADEMRSVIEEHYDKLAGTQGGNAGAAQPAAGSAGGEDMAAALAAEVAQLKDRKQRRFDACHTGVRGCVFVEFPKEPAEPDPVAVVLSICQEACDTKMLRGRHVNRLLPITHACFAGMDEMKAIAPSMLEPHFPKGATEGVEFAVDYEHRSSDKFDRAAVIDTFVDCIDTPPHKVNLKTPGKTILVQITRNAVGMSVVPRYRELHKFNLRKCAEVPEEDGGGKPQQGGKQPTAGTTEQPADKQPADQQVKGQDAPTTTGEAVQPEEEKGGEGQQAAPEPGEAAAA